jgi:hypothetical protein
MSTPTKPGGAPINAGVPQPGESGYREAVDAAFGTEAGAKLIEQLRSELDTAGAEASGRWLRMDLVRMLLDHRAELDAARVIMDAAALEAYITSGRWPEKASGS